MTHAQSDVENGPKEADHEKKQLPAAAERALAEARQRQADLDAEMAKRPREINGRGGRDPARYGDWEKKGIAIDF